ncbi:MAG: TetR family transcriptional regulator [Solirubrobacterales bacterium]|nr:TetR family transcriptional regulator [Solirubrobacterales bacterium]
MARYTTPVVTQPQARTTRRDQVADAALRVLGESGSRALTHRAVDSAARVPQGTTSNYFRTRSSLLEAAFARHAELDTPPEAALAGVADLELSDEEALDILMVVLDRLMDDASRGLLKARYELVLESSRDRDLLESFKSTREKFLALAEALVKARGCRTPSEHGKQLLVVMDGALLDTVPGASTALDRDGIRDLLARQLKTC